MLYKTKFVFSLRKVTSLRLDTYHTLHVHVYWTVLCARALVSTLTCVLTFI